MLPHICLFKYNFKRWPILTFPTFKENERKILDLSLHLDPRLELTEAFYGSFLLQLLVVLLMVDQRLAVQVTSISF